MGPVIQQGQAQPGTGGFVRTPPRAAQRPEAEVPHTWPKKALLGQPFVHQEKNNWLAT